MNRPNGFFAPSDFMPSRIASESDFVSRSKAMMSSLGQFAGAFGTMIAMSVSPLSYMKLKALTWSWVRYTLYCRREEKA